MMSATCRPAADRPWPRGIRPGELAEVGVAGSALGSEINRDRDGSLASTAPPRRSRPRSLGASIVIDDFGTGYSALDYLKRSWSTASRSTRSFTAGPGRLGPDEEIVRASIAFAHALGLEVTAEGIETRAQLERLSDLGCDRGQGYLIGRPVQLEDVSDCSTPISPACIR